MCVQQIPFGAQGNLRRLLFFASEIAQTLSHQLTLRPWISWTRPPHSSSFQPCHDFLFSWTINPCGEAALVQKPSSKFQSLGGLSCNTSFLGRFPWLPTSRLPDSHSHNTAICNTHDDENLSLQNYELQLRALVVSILVAIKCPGSCPEEVLRNSFLSQYILNM